MGDPIIGCKSPASSHQLCLFSVLLIHALVCTSIQPNVVLSISEASDDALNKMQDFGSYRDTQGPGFRAALATFLKKNRSYFSSSV